MVELVKWLRAQLDEDELVARNTGQPGTSWRNFDMDGELRDDLNAGTVAYVPRVETRVHIARHDPARVLRESDAKRQIAAWRRQPTQKEFSSGRYRTMGCRCGDGWPCATLRLIALPYADRPGYQESWRP
ncbi:DUF6221 family protein [Streptomyces griseorubiginosus]|uniref:DUF6221 family protein n=1 Tax=Streptomyces griseorubiginosus TaxID=67304 RepID=UPI003634E09A